MTRRRKKRFSSHPQGSTKKNNSNSGSRVARGLPPTMTIVSGGAYKFPSMPCVIVIPIVCYQRKYSEFGGLRGVQSPPRSTNLVYVREVLKHTTFTHSTIENYTDTALPANEIGFEWQHARGEQRPDVARHNPYIRVLSMKAHHQVADKHANAHV